MTGDGPRLAAAGIGVSDLARSTDFYIQVFGLRKLAELPLETFTEAILTAKGSHVALVLMEHTDGVARDLANTGGKIAFTVPDPAVTAALAVEHGATMVVEPTPLDAIEGRRIAFVTDPDGHLVELIEA